MAVLLGLIVATTYGAADFFGGLSTKRAPVATVVVVSQICGLPVIAVLVLFTGGSPTLKVLTLGAAAGVIVGVALTCLYRGLATGRMSVVAPITAVGAAIVPLAWGLVRGERPSGVALTGAVLAIFAVVLIARATDEPGAGGDAGAEGAGDARMALALAVIAGFAFGAVFVLLAETGPDAGFWPLVTSRAASIAVLSAGSVIGGRSLRPPPGVFATIAVTGVFDIVANAFYLLAARQGLLSLVAVLAALYPASTVVLARLVLGERLHRVQMAGLVLAATGVALIAGG